MCDAIALFLGLFGGFFSAVCASRDWFDHRFPVKEEKVGRMVDTIESQHLTGGTGGQDCKEIAKKISKSMRWYRIWMFTPTAIFVLCMLLSTALACTYFEQITHSSSPEWLKPWFLGSCSTLVASMVASSVFAILCRAKAHRNFELLRRDENWCVTPENQDEYDSITPATSRPAQTILRQGKKKSQRRHGSQRG